MQCAKRLKMKKKHNLYYANTGIENKVSQIVCRQATKGVHAQCTALGQFVVVEPKN